MGLGVLGSAAARALKVFGYQVRGWSCSPKSLEGVACYAGPGELDAFLADTDILAVLLPLTPDTHGILDRRLLAKLSRRGRDARLPGPVLINAGRGGLQVDADIAASLAAGELYAASLDVFEAEPLPHSSPLWSHPRVVVTPHNAAESAPAAIVRYALRQIAALRRGEPCRTSSTASAGIEGDVIPAGARQRGEPGPRGHNHSRRSGSRIFRLAKFRDDRTYRDAAKSCRLVRIRNTSGKARSVIHIISLKSLA